MNKSRIIIVSGLALFAMFVGAGNLIFPPQLGAEAGSAYLPATLGFLCTGIGLVFMGVVATTRAGGHITDLGHHLGKVPISVFSILAMLAIGPGLAIPRTAATTYEFLKGSLFPDFPAWLSSAIFFSIVLFFVFRPSRVVDLIGNFLTPGLIIVLAIIIIKGIVTPLGEIIPTGMKAVFSTSFEKGYQTMDAIGAMCFTSIVVASFVNKGVHDHDELVSCTIKAGIIASIGIAALYSGLLYIGATTSSLTEIHDFAYVDRLIFIAEGLLGKLGSVFMCLAMVLACLTTAIGLSSTVGEFFEKLSHGRIRMRWAILASTAFSYYFSISGVDKIVAIAAPILAGIYPLAIVLIVLNFFYKSLDHKALHMGCSLGALFPTVEMILNGIDGHISLMEPLENLFPESFRNFAWILPVVVLGLLAQLLLPRLWPQVFKKQPNE